MCGRFKLDGNSPAIRAMLEEIAHEQGDVPIKTGEIFPTDLVPVLQNRGGRPGARAMSWGFPRWDGKGVVFNARAETALDKPMFRKALLHNPVVVPTSGFYEWKAEAGRRKKDKYLFREPDTELLYLAGFSNSFSLAPADVPDCFTILTTEANPDMASYHNRMPVLLRAGEREDWLSGRNRAVVLQREPFAVAAEPAG